MRIIVCGDFNDLRHQFSNISLLTGLTPIINFKTRGENTLDQVFVNFASDKNPSCLPPFACSDHCVIYWSPVPPAKCSVTKKCVRKFSRANVARLKDSVSKINWLSFVQYYSTDKLNEYFSDFVDAFNTLVDMHFPLRTIRVRDTEPP